MQKGNDLISAHVHYAHEASPGVLYEVKLGPIHFESNGNAVIRAESQPVEGEWRFVSIFRDGFESGLYTFAWSEVSP